MKNVSCDTFRAPIYTIATCLNEIIVNVSLHDALQNIVEWLAETMEVEQCYILEHGNQDKQQLLFSSLKSTSSTDLVVLKTQYFPDIHRVLAGNSSCRIGINNPGIKQNQTNRPQLQSLFIVPVFSREKFWGSLGFAGASGNDRLLNSEKQLDILATAIGAALENNRAKVEIEQLDQVLHESNEKINTILNNSKEIILTVDLEKNEIENVNDAISILGYEPGEWIGGNYKTWVNDQRQQFHKLMKLAVQSELRVENQQITFKHKTNDEHVPFEFSTSIFFFKNTKYLLCVLRDIRERLSYEKSLTSMSTQLAHLINNIDDVYAIYDLTTDSYDFVSDNIEKLYGCKKEAFLNNNELWRTNIYEEDSTRIEQEAKQIITEKGKGQLFYRITGCNNVRKIILEKLVVGKDDHGNANKLYIVKTDYTDVENAEQSLLETERKFRFISENISDFISIHDPDGNFTYASPSIQNILGYQPNEILGLGAFDLIHPEDMLKTMDQALQPIVIDKKEVQLRYRMVAKDGNYKWVETYSKPVIDSKGQTSSIISSTRDVSDQVIAEQKLKDSVAEREKLLVELEQSLAKERELNELRSMFVSTASHQFRTPLTVIQSGVEIMEMYIEDLPELKQEKFQKQFNKIQMEVNRLHYLMNDILLLGRANAARTPFHPEALDVVEFCREIIDNKYNNRYSDERSIVMAVTGEPTLVDFDPKLLGHAIENILSNAYKYSYEGHLFLDVQFKELQVQIHITDQGIGIPEDDLKNLFQPFSRAANTKDIEGTGLGLAIVQEFIEKHRGKINIDSKLNKGTTVSVILPVKQKL
jgi:PAS domain S-box-containing protein